MEQSARESSVLLQAERFNPHTPFEFLAIQLLILILKRLINGNS